MHVSQKWLYHLDACAGTVLAPHDYVTNVQKRLGNRACTDCGQCRPCGSCLDPQLEHGETCSTAEATRGHDACVHAVLGGLKLADPGISMESRGLAEAQSMPADLFTTAAVPGRSAALDVCVWRSTARKSVMAPKHTVVFEEDIELRDVVHRGASSSNLGGRATRLLTGEGNDVLIVIVWCCGVCPRVCVFVVGGGARAHWLAESARNCGAFKFET